MLLLLNIEHKETSFIQALRLFGDRTANIIETNMGVGGWSGGFLLTGHNVVGIEVSERQYEFAKHNVSALPAEVDAMYAKPFRLPLTAVLVDRAHHTPYDAKDPKNRYLPIPLLFDPRQGGSANRTQWKKVFGNAQTILVRKYFQLCSCMVRTWICISMSCSGSS
jgi:hypothetical protein